MKKNVVYTTETSDYVFERIYDRSWYEKDGSLEKVQVVIILSSKIENLAEEISRRVDEIIRQSIADTDVKYDDKGFPLTQKPLSEEEIAARNAYWTPERVREYWEEDSDRRAYWHSRGEAY